MLGLITVVITRFVLWLASLLPASPFSGISFPTAVETALGWLNWVVPFGRFGEILALWLSVLVVAVIVRAIVENFVKNLFNKSVGVE